MAPACLGQSKSAKSIFSLFFAGSCLDTKRFLVVRLSVSQTNPKLTKSNQQNHSTSHIQWPLQQQQPIKNKRITVFKKFRSNWRLFPTRMAVCRGLKFASQAMEQIKVHRTLFQEALMWPPPQKRQPYPIVSHTKVNSPRLALANEGFINANHFARATQGLL